MSRFQSSRRLRLAASAFSLLALVLSVAPAVSAVGGLTNCIEATGPSSNLRGCWEHVWVDGVEYRMTFWGGEKPFKGSVSTQSMGEFYVVGPQTDSPQSLDHPFAHDHVVATLPRHNGGEYMPVYQGILVVCSAQGISGGACTPTNTGLAMSVNGQPLTSVEAIEAASAANLVTLVPSGVVIGTLGIRQ
jgi:hypothetical protein